MEHGVVDDENVFARSVLQSLLSYAGFHAESVVAAVYGVVCEQSLSAVSEVECITVLCVPRASYCDVCHHDILAVAWVDMEAGGVLHRHSVNEHTLAVFKSHEVSPCVSLL